MKDWKTIDTAPKDGTWFWAFYPRQNAYEDQFAVAAWIETQGNEPMFWDAAQHRDDEQPTHWMPLPLLPFGAGCNPRKAKS
jgi:hypothetical protein